jgi:hypothetical protein
LFKNKDKNLGRRWEAEGKRQKAKGNRQKAKGRRQKAEGKKDTAIKISSSPARAAHFSIGQRPMKNGILTNKAL